MKRCSGSEFGCCPDGKTAAPAPHHGGCPSKYFSFAVCWFIEKKHSKTLCTAASPQYYLVGEARGKATTLAQFIIIKCCHC